MIYIINCGARKTGRIKKVFDKHQIDSTLVSLKELGSVLAQPDISGLVIGGKAFHFNEKNIEEYKELFSFIETAHYPILGICFGHQIIGLIHGAEAFSGKMVWGKKKVFYKKDDPIFGGIPDGSRYYQSHHDWISLPDEFVLLADSESCPNEAMRHAAKPIYGLQFHPERSGKAGEQLLVNFAKC